MQGLLRMTKDNFKSTTKVARLWVHECERVFRDRLVNEHDLAKYDDMLSAALKTWFKEENLAEVTAAPNLFTSFMDQSGDGAPLFNQVCCDRACDVCQLATAIHLVRSVIVLQCAQGDRSHVWEDKKRSRGWARVLLLSSTCLTAIGCQTVHCK